MSLRMAPSAVSLALIRVKRSASRATFARAPRSSNDILIDDILRTSKVHGGTTARALRKVDNFSQFYTKPDSAMFEAVLKTKPFQQDIELQKANRETAGTIEVRISVLRRTGETHALTDTN